MHTCHWLLVDDFGNLLYLDCEFGSLTLDAAYEFYVDGKETHHD